MPLSKVRPSAERAGLVKGDVLLTFSGQSVNKRSELAAIQGTTKLGSRVKVTIWRTGTEQDMELQFPAVEHPNKKKHTA